MTYRTLTYGGVEQALAGWGIAEEGCVLSLGNMEPDILRVAVPAAAWAIGLPVLLKILATLLGVLVIVRHRSNIRRLLSGTEHRWKRKPPEGANGTPPP